MRSQALTVKRRNKMANNMYDPALDDRNLIRNFPALAITDISTLWNKLNSEWRLNLEEECAKIATAHGLAAKDVEKYYHWYDDEKPRNCVVFYNKSKWLHDGTGVFGARYDDELLPRGSVACAFISGKGAILLVPYLEDAQKDELHAVLQNALTRMGLFNYVAEDITIYGALVF